MLVRWVVLYSLWDGWWSLSWPRKITYYIIYVNVYESKMINWILCLYIFILSALKVIVSQGINDKMLHHLYLKYFLSGWPNKEIIFYVGDESPAAFQTAHFHWLIQEQNPMRMSPLQKCSPELRVEGETLNHRHHRYTRSFKPRCIIISCLTDWLHLTMHSAMGDGVDYHRVVSGLASIQPLSFVVCIHIWIQFRTPTTIHHE